MEDILKDIEEININRKLYSMTYRKTGLYVLYPFLIFVVLVVVALLTFQRDIVIELNGMISNPDTGLVVLPLTTGRVDNILVNNHQDVVSGDVLITFDTSEIERDIYLKNEEISELNLRLAYLNYFEESVVKGENLLPSEMFGYSLRIEQHFRNLRNGGVELNHLTQVRDTNVANITRQISELETLVVDYQNFNRIVNGLSYNRVSSEVVRVKVREFRANLATFDYYTRQQRSVFVANTLLQIEQNISNHQSEIRRLNDELRVINRNFAQESGNFDNQEINASESLIIEIFDSRENVLNQIQTLERQLENLQEEYQNHTLIATADGRFQMTEQIALGSNISFGSELGRIFNISYQDNYILGQFSSSDFNRIQLGQTVTFVLMDGDNNRHLVFGTIQLIGQAPIRAEHGNIFIFHASIDTNHSDLELRYGMTGELNIITGRTSWWNYLIQRFF